MRVVQEDIKTLRILIVPWDRLAHELRQLLSQRLQYYWGTTEMTFIIEEVPEIPQTPVGKNPFVISQVSIEEYL